MITLLLGGARSGKSQLAERLAASWAEPVTYVATASADPDDADYAARIDAHRRRRPVSWVTVECGAELPRALDAATGTVLVDALGAWVAATPGFAVNAPRLCEALLRRDGHTVVVSDEVGMGVHPETEIGRRFRDVLGALNQAVAVIADDVLLVVAGRVVPLESR